MNTQAGLQQCLTFINCHVQPPKAPFSTYQPENRRRAITISRQVGSGGHSIAEKLLELLHAQQSAESCPWAIFDRNLVERVLKEHHLPDRLAKFMPEDRISEISDTMDELFGLHPPSWTLVRETADTMLRLAELGNVILIGRGANVVTRNLDYVFHVRLVGSLEQRVRRTQETNHLSLKNAMDLVRREDRGRRRYLKKYFKKDIDDPLLYHLVINTDLVPYDEAVRMIAEAVMPKTQKAS